MPSRNGGGVQARLSLAKPAVTPHPQMPDFAHAWLGKPTPPAYASYPVSEVQIMYWCDMVEDANPLYADGEYARTSRHGGVIAPPMSLITFMTSRAGQRP